MEDKHIYLIRHGESVANANGIDMGQNSQLSEKGRLQSKILAERIANISDIEGIISSSFPRAYETAMIIHAHTNISIEFNELFVQRKRPSILQGKPHNHQEAIQIMKNIFDGYLVPNYRHSDEENLDDLSERAVKSLNYLAQHRWGKICVITHGMFLRTIFATIFSNLKLSGNYLRQSIECLEPDNAGISHIVYDKSYNPISCNSSPRWRIISWNDISHHQKGE